MTHAKENNEKLSNPIFHTTACSAPGLLHWSRPAAMEPTCCNGAPGACFVCGTAEESFRSAYSKGVPLNGSSSRYTMGARPVAPACDGACRGLV